MKIPREYFDFRTTKLDQPCYNVLDFVMKINPRKMQKNGMADHLIICINVIHLLSDVQKSEKVFNGLVNEG